MRRSFEAATSHASLLSALLAFCIVHDPSHGWKHGSKTGSPSIESLLNAGNVVVGSANGCFELRVGSDAQGVQVEVVGTLGIMTIVRLETYLDQNDDWDSEVTAEAPGPGQAHPALAAIARRSWNSHKYFLPRPVVVRMNSQAYVYR